MVKMFSKKEIIQLKEKKIQKQRFDYSWVIVGLCFLVIFTSMGLCSSGRTLYLTAITEALGIPRSAFSLNDTFRYVTTTIINLFFGSLIIRLGTKKMLCIGFLCLIGFALINATTTHLIGFYFAAILLGIGISFTGTTMISSTVHKWCKKNKATITGAILAANGLGGAIAVQILSPIIFQEGNPFGYQISYKLVACVLAVMFILVVILYKEPPRENVGEKTDNTAGKKKVRGEGWIGMEYADIIRKPYFYISLLATFMIGMTLQGLNGIAVPHMYDVGLDIEYVALLTSISGIMLSFSKFLTGWIYDRIGIKWSMNICLTSAFLAVFALVFLGNTPAGRVIAAGRTVFQAIAFPLETVMLPIFVTEFFGNKAFDKLTGIFVAVSAAGFALGAPFGNICFDIFGDYKLAFLIFAILMVFVTVMLQYVLVAAKKDRVKILEEYEKEKALIDA